jgi:uncharacterized protein (TIGR00251 family)
VAKIISHTFIKLYDSHLELFILVVPNARKTEIIGQHDGRLKIKIHAPPVDGKANQEIVEFLSDFLKISKSQISVAKGLLSRKKNILIMGLVATEFKRVLSLLVAANEG